MKYILHFFVLWLPFYINAQTPQNFGFRHQQYVFENDTVHVLIKSKKGDENKKKPLLFYNQGSKAVPLIIHNGTQRVAYSCMLEGFVEENYHLVIVNKPGVPLMAHKDSLLGREYFKNKEEYLHTEKYLKNNNLTYYTKTNLRVLDSLIKFPWVDKTKVVVAGHSQGSSVALNICANSSIPTHLIYSSGLPYYSTIMSLINRRRMKETSKSDPKIHKYFKDWQEVVQDTTNYYNPNRDSNKMLFSFSKLENETLLKLKIPVLISYGTKDESYPFNDMFHVETIKKGRTNFTFFDYFGLGHSYEVKVDNKEMKKDYLKTVVDDWLQWIKEN
ncbi:alpha/beta hydrolase family protein [Polaribacter sp.]|uniref:alpha/beta hydrolase family protein n=1 Tax=Polaribacter sp. TaxID=1920175 RepID=UPI003F6BDA1A